MGVDPRREYAKPRANKPDALPRSVHARRTRRLEALVADWRKSAAEVLASPRASLAERAEAFLLQTCANRVEAILMVEEQIDGRFRASDSSPRR
jgi:hypothetical protein